MLKIGISKGRIENEYFKYLIENEIFREKLFFNGRELSFIYEGNIYLSLKSRDVVNMLCQGLIDVGVVGSDVINEYDTNNLLTEIGSLDKGISRFALATYEGYPKNLIKNVATKYPNTAKESLSSINLNCNILEMQGSLEIAPLLGYADAIYDVVATGATLCINNLKILETFDNINTKIVTRFDNIDNLEVVKYSQRIRKP